MDVFVRFSFRFCQNLNESFHVKEKKSERKKCPTPKTSELKKCPNQQHLNARQPPAEISDGPATVDRKFHETQGGPTEDLSWPKVV